MEHAGLLARLRRAALSAGLVFACLGIGGLAGNAAAQGDAPATAKVKIDNGTCLGCHDGTKGKLEVPTAAGKPRALSPVDQQKFEKGVHSQMECVACHADIKDNAEKNNAHQKDAQPLAKVDCASCHQELWEQTVKRGRADDRPRLKAVATNIENYKKSFHARPNPDDKTKPNATCSQCHDTHSFNVPVNKSSTENTQWRLGISERCGSCHSEQLDTYKESVHGKENAKRMLADAATCSDCHFAHKVANTSSEPFKLTVTAQCGNCHGKQFDAYKDTFHGAANTLGYGYTAKCYDCHGSHDIVRVKDPASKVHPDNRLETCGSCHNAKKGLAPVSKGFVSFQPHAEPGNFTRYPEVTAASWGMSGLLIGTFAFFWLHTILWFYREWKDRRERGGGPVHVRVDEVPVALQAKQFQRFTRTWRIAHFTFALSVMVLAITGMPLFYPEVPWAHAVMNFFGGPKVTGLIHRCAATVFASIFFWHLFYVVIKLGRQWRTWKVFGPYSMVPNLKDLQDCIGMFKWFLGQGPRPKIDRWGYWEKFDYWAPFWGVTIIGVSGLIMWMPSFAGQFLPGWVFNVATIFHSEEAFLAVVFLFTVHFFNNHFRPDKFPVDVVMFTGSMPLDEFKKEHPLEYQRLLQSGELEKHLVEPPSKLQMKLSRLLGFTLILIGLTILTLVAIGFFSTGGPSLPAGVVV
ncbi:multiheme c-type cytochrome [Ramlibacter alkalitolerans]|uniref:Cytochrome C n=1 Tax=Ramlibacter alkalitolerans TaxID=2039631 RepID=A0ABS1JLI2_9BURK|nr:cytochrome C [Ramlibacter alkalitolerans]MBL0425036.1 cytochrome C [Ramlibacter alkalitolerans]